MTSTAQLPVIKLIVGSVRPVRIGDQLAEAIAPILEEASGTRVEIVDLARINLPLLDEPKMPSLGNYVHPHSLAWSQIIEESDAVVFLTPQYNGGYPASVKNAVDYLYNEWKEKPALIISYGGSGGRRAADQLRSVLEFIGLDLPADNVGIVIPRDGYGPNSRLIDAASVVAAAAEQLSTAGKLIGAKLPVAAL